MYLFDLHCDTLTRCIKKSEPIAFANGHVSLEAGARIERWAQVFAAFVPDTLHGQEAAERADSILDFYRSQRPMIKSVCKPILSIENGNALAGDLGKLRHFAARGVRIITLTWNGENELGHGIQCDPSLGLKPFGKSAVQAMFRLGIIPDVSHLNQAGFRDVAALSAKYKKSFWATHSNCGEICSHPRNLSDDQLRAVFRSGGLVGINLFTELLGGEGTAKDVARHLDHMISLGGEDHVALGSDFDGCRIHPSLCSLENLEYLDSMLEKYGFSGMQRKKFFWSNAAKRLLA